MIIPKGISLKNWAHSLVIDFPNDNIPLLVNEDDWKAWANLVIEQTTFAENGAPDPDSYTTWTDWADKLFLALANNP